MPQQIIEHPWIFSAFLMIIVALWIAAAIRIKHDRIKKHRAKVDRRKLLRSEQDRRWENQN
jgi:hypothetical protein